MPTARSITRPLSTPSMARLIFDATVVPERSNRERSPALSMGTTRSPVGDQAQRKQ